MSRQPPDPPIHVRTPVGAIDGESSRSWGREPCDDAWTVERLDWDATTLSG
jgi:hypothetical protein